MDTGGGAEDRPDQAVRPGQDRAAARGADVKVEKVKDGKEKIKAAGKDYECQWQTYKVTGKAMGVEISADVKVWTSKDLPLQVVKMESTAEVGQHEGRVGDGVDRDRQQEGLRARGQGSVGQYTSRGHAHLRGPWSF